MNQSTIDLLWAAALDQKSTNTKRAYRADFRTFIKMVGAQSEIDAFAQLLASSEAAESLMIRIRNGDMTQSRRSGKAPRSINRMLATLRLLLRVARRHGIFSGRIYNVQSLRVGYRSSGTNTSVDEIVKVLSCAKLDETHTGRRVYAILWLSLDLNLTLDAIRALNIGDLDLGNMRIWISDEHAHAYRWREMAAVTVSALVRWLELRKKWGTERLSPLFVARPARSKNKPLSEGQFRSDIRKAFLRAGLEGGQRTLIEVSRRETVFGEDVVRMFATSIMGLSPRHPLVAAQAVAIERQFGSLIANARAQRFLPSDTNGESCPRETNFLEHPIVK